MKETTGLLEKIRHHDKVCIALNENCAIPLPEDVLQIFFQPHRLSYYYFHYLKQGSATFRPIWTNSPSVAASWLSVFLTRS